MVALWYLVEGIVFGAYYIMVVLLVNALLAKPATEQNPLNRLMQKIILCCGAFNLVRAVDLDGVMEILNWRLLDMISANTTMLIVLLLMIALFAMLNMAYGSFGENDKKLPNVVNMRRGLFVFWGLSVVVVNSFSVVSGLYDVVWPIGVYFAFIGLDVTVLVVLYNATAFHVARYFGQVSRATRALLLQPAQSHDVIRNALYRLKMVQLGSVVMGVAAVAIFVLETYNVLNLGLNAKASSRYPNKDTFRIVAPSVIMQAVLIGANLWAVWDGTVCCTGRYNSEKTPAVNAPDEEGSFEPPSATPTFRNMSGAISIRKSTGDFGLGLPPRMSPLTSSFLFHHHMGLNVFSSGTPGTPVLASSRAAGP